MAVTLHTTLGDLKLELFCVSAALRWRPMRLIPSSLPRGVHG